ncbi:hypothetical protein [Pseudomonas sp. R5(2019)]|uniref:hypothetical protein n=1 Tax=Pseudomonas sp. R5(2019) TaxID=2697566 RepID=UPI0014135FA8|nr:hypothetical protein [Pseudomonas sp. R5(2019)]NBA94784.1 hypothetical protein [Pseudomonas sp. R5(2019)]
MRASNMLVSVSQHRLPCILDPALVLGSVHGPTLALRLAQVLEPWLPRSFWQLIDASELIMPTLEGDSTDGEYDPARPSIAALLGWMALREGIDAGSWPLRWVGDSLAESQIQQGSDAGVVERYESILEWLLQRHLDADTGPGPGHVRCDPEEGALDMLALSAALEGAVVLTLCPACGQPWPVRALESVRLGGELVSPIAPESLFAAERELIRGALASAGMAALVQQLPPLMVFHLLPSNGRAFSQTWEAATGQLRRRVLPSLDDDFRAWWYYL